MSASAASRSSRRRSLAVEGCRRPADPDQHHRHARSRRLHRRSRAVIAGPGRCRRRVLGRRGGGSPERDGLAAGLQVPRSPDLLHQQDGPYRHRVRAGLPRDPGAPARKPPDPRPDPHRGRPRRDDGRVPGLDRPDRDEGSLLTRPRTWARRSPRPRFPRPSVPRPNSGASRCSTAWPTRTKGSPKRSWRTWREPSWTRARSWPACGGPR